MKKFFLLLTAVVFSVTVKAQKQLEFPFQGGQQVMEQFFKSNFTPSADIRQHSTSGVVILKFTADQKGNLKKVIVYYADDFALAQPAADLLQKTNHKWIVPEGEKLHDFILPFSVAFTNPAAVVAKKSFATGYSKRSPIITSNQIPLDMATLLPTIQLSYDPAAL